PCSGARISDGGGAPFPPELRRFRFLPPPLPNMLNCSDIQASVTQVTARPQISSALVSLYRLHAVCDWCDAVGARAGLRPPAENHRALARVSCRRMHSTCV